MGSAGMTDGLSVRVETPDASWWDRIVAFDARNFGISADHCSDPVHREVQPLDRFRIAVVGDRLAGVATSVPLELTLPGGVQVAATGVTWVSVGAGYRRRGVLTHLLDAVHADGRERGEVAQILFASEAPIYGRFGYGEVTQWWGVEVDAASARLHPTGVLPGDMVPVHDDADPLTSDHVLAVFDEFRRHRPGEVNRAEPRWRMMRGRWSQPIGDAGSAHVITCDDGYAIYRVTPNWDAPERGERPSHILTVVDLVALTPQAHRSLWHRLVNTDLVATVRCGVLALHDPLPLLLADRRWLRTVSWHDGLWMRVDEPVELLAARRYGIDDRLTLQVNGRTVTVEAHGGVGHCTTDAAQADLIVDPRAMGALVMGAGHLGRLAAAGLVHPASATALGRADRLLAGDGPPHCSTLF